MLLASSPSRIGGPEGDRVGTRRVAVVDAEPGNRGHRLHRHVGTRRQSVAAHAAGHAAERDASRRAAGTVVQVKAVNAKGLEGWDWARGVVKQLGLVSVGLCRLRLDASGAPVSAA